MYKRSSIRLFCQFSTEYLPSSTNTIFQVQVFRNAITIYFTFYQDTSSKTKLGAGHPRRPRGSQSCRDKGCDESFQVRTKEPLGTDSHQAISKNSSGCRLLIGHKKCFVLLCPIREQFLLSSFREFVHDGYCFDHGLSGSWTKQWPKNCTQPGNCQFDINPHPISKYCLREN